MDEAQQEQQPLLPIEEVESTPGLHCFSQRRADVVLTISLSVSDNTHDQKSRCIFLVHRFRCGLLAVTQDIMVRRLSRRRY
jgi:hypothetical protein